MREEFPFFFSIQTHFNQVKPITSTTQHTSQQQLQQAKQGLNPKTTVIPKAIVHER